MVSHKSLLVIIFFTPILSVALSGEAMTASLSEGIETTQAYRKDMKVFANKKVNNTVPINHFFSGKNYTSFS